MQQVENAGAVLAIGLVECLNSFPRVGEQWFIIRQSAFGSVTEIGQQGKEKMRIAIAEIADLQSFEKMINFFRLAQQGGDNYHGAVNSWNVFRKIQSW